MPLMIGFYTKHIRNPWSTSFNPAKVSLMAFAVLFKILSTHCVLLLHSGGVHRRIFNEFKIEKILRDFFFCGILQCKYLHLALFSKIVNIILTSSVRFSNLRLLINCNRRVKLQKGNQSQWQRN